MCQFSLVLRLPIRPKIATCFNFGRRARLGPVFVLVTGLPGSGKTQLAAPLAASLALPLLAKDTMKEALWDALGPGDREWGRQLGTAAAVALESLARSLPGAVIDHFVHAGFSDEWESLPDLVEVRCACAPEIARERYAARRRHPSHFDTDQLTDSYDGWIVDDAARPPLGPRLDVDTATPVDIDSIARWVRSEWKRV